MKTNSTIVLFLFVLCFYKPTSANAQVNTNDSLALVDLYNRTGGSITWADRTNWLTSAPVSSWYGI